MRWIFLDKIDELIVGDSIEGVHTWDPDLEIFKDHFPTWPVVPGVLLMEALAQLSGKLIGVTVREQRGDWPFPILSMMKKVKFRSFVLPGQEVLLKASFVSLRDESAHMRVSAWVEGKRKASAEQTFVFNADPIENPAERAELEAVEGGELARLWSGFDSSSWAAR
jgi:3-hydroxymyristoyl/3-hydroxydecanoyl-(acyl carrier protein) dehydratase